MRPMYEEIIKSHFQRYLIGKDNLRIEMFWDPWLGGCDSRVWECRLIGYISHTWLKQNADPRSIATGGPVFQRVI